MSDEGGSVAQHSAAPMAPPFRVVIVGSGPRGLSVLERVAARALIDPPEGRIEIDLIDSVAVGTGRVWKVDQPKCFLMNTPAGEVSAFSGRPDGGPPRPGAGPSLAEWLDLSQPGASHDLTYAPRAAHGEYMQFVLTAIERHLPDTVGLRRLKDEVTDLESCGSGYAVSLRSGTRLRADRVVLTTGHGRPTPTGDHRTYSAYADTRTPVRYFRGDSPADMPLASIPPGSTVGVIGLGLTFYDVMAALTEGRGGRFHVTDDGSYDYIPSGDEPVLVAGSRSSLPVLGRGKNQKDADFRYSPRLFRPEKVLSRSSTPLSFTKDVWPWLHAEMQLVYYETAIRRDAGADAARSFVSSTVATLDVDDTSRISRFAERFGIADLPPLDLDLLTRPFRGRQFPTSEAFTSALTRVIRSDISHSVQGNVDSPLKAALEVLRDSRASIRGLVDFGGLTPRSHRDEFLAWFAPRASFLAAGPPVHRVRQVLALIEAGSLTIVGPDVRVRVSKDSPGFVMDSPHVCSPPSRVSMLIDARIPTPNVSSDTSTLTRSLLSRGVITSFINCAGSDSFDTGGVAVSRSPYHPIGSTGSADRGIYVLGIPTEHTRWFMQAGSSRPGFWTDFVRDADAIAADVLGAALATTTTSVSTTESSVGDELHAANTG
ncbi:FAD/NAD(P)-binding protein [Rathayibacter tritici]|uniref:FAD/NAD(P)-binding protein n=2 Tax=Rathayibacter tritici TaxID=33888 RepID=UPI00147580E9|nr:FAD/NAD(P)-binding protein [Rathayibacter tritici]